MPIIPLNDRKVASLSAGDVRAEYYDQALPAFGMRVTPNGVKTFFVMYRAGARLRRMTLGKYPLVKLAAARTKARAALEQVSNGLDPMAERDTAAERTFGALATLYIEKYAKPRKRSWRDDDRMIRHDLNVWKHRQVETISRREIRALLEAIVDRGAPVGANRVLSLIRKMLNFALDREWITANPAHRMQAPSKERSRDRVLSDDEIRQLWDFLHAPISVEELADVPEAERPAARRYLQLARGAYLFRLITAQRGTEVVSLRVEDVRDTWWTIPGTIAKNGLAHRVPLTPLALAELDRLREQGLAGATHVFQGVRGTRQRRGALDGLELPDFQPRDMRRTAASRMAGAGVDRMVIAKILNHVETGITAVYDRHGYDDEKRAGLLVWDATLTAIIAAPRQY